MNCKNIKLLISFVILIFSIYISAHSQSIKQMDERANEYYAKGEFNKAITEWLMILEIDPENEEIQKKIESLYDRKHTKDVTLQKSKIQLKLAKRTLYKNLRVSESNADKAWDNFVTAYRIDPKDPELQLMREEMKVFMNELKIEKAKKRLSESMRKKYQELLVNAQNMMKLEKYEEAIKYWEEILYIVPLDKTANEGKRQAELAISNRLKFERIMALMNSGIALFEEKKYSEAKMEFLQALRIDPDNNRIQEYIDDIDDKLDDIRNYEMRKMQAEQFYVSGIRNLARNNFDRAEEDFENTLAIIDNYKDASLMLKNINKLRKKYEEKQRTARLKKIDNEFRNGLLALAEGRYKDAVIYFDATLRLDPENGFALKYIQTAKEALKQIQEERVDKDSPYYGIINSLIVSGKLLYERGDYVESRKRWEKILDIFPKNRIATEYLLKTNLKLNPAAFDAFSKRIINEGNDLLKAKKYRDALKKFEMIKSISQNYPNIDKLIANAKNGLKKKTIIEAPKVSPMEIEKKSKLGIEFYSKGGKENLENALTQFQWVNKNDPNNLSAVIYINKIESQLRIETFTDQTSARKLSSKQKRLIKTHYFKGINYYFNNNFHKAITEWRKVLAIDPTHDKAKMNIRKCLVLLKR